MQAGLTRVIIVDYLEELTCEFDVVSVVSLLLNRVLVLLEPATDLVHQEELRFRVAEQVEKLNRWFSPFDDIIKALVGFLEAFKGRVIIYIREPLAIKLILESFQSVSELGPRWYIFGTLTNFMVGLFTVFTGATRVLSVQALLLLRLLLFFSFDLLCGVRV